MSDECEKQHLENWRRQVAKSAGGGVDNFLSYFDTAADLRESFVQGSWDFASHILKPAVPRLLGEPFRATALEIGFGGGRLLAAASRYFDRVIGIDIHDRFDEVRVLLASQNVDNVELLRGDGRTLPVADDSVDFVYSFIVLQHLPLMSTLQSYLAEVKRALRPGRPACLYFGHLPFAWRGIRYVDLQTRSVSSTRENTLLLRPGKTRSLLRAAGLEVVEMGRPRKKPWRREPGEQHYAIVTA